MRLPNRRSAFDFLPPHGDSGMRLHGLLGLAVCLCPMLVFAAGEKQTFPYEAVIETSSAYVRSGPGEQYYPTKRMIRGTHVRVHRHDSGGWYMIAPPEGSFSWIAAQFVQITGRATGEVVEDNIAAYVGTDFGDERSVFQRRLSPGESFQIIGEKVVSTDRGPEKMLKIRSPRREWRWVAGQDVVALSVHNQQPEKPSANPPASNRQPSGGEFTNRSTPRRRTEQPDWNNPNLKIANGGGPATRRPARDGKEILARLKADRRQLDTLDADFRLAAQSDKSQWDFAKIEAGYTSLQDATASPALRSQIRMRFAALNRYQKAKAIYDDITRLTNETNRRDAELLSMQSGGVTPAYMTSAQPAGQTTRMSATMESGYLDAGAQLPTQRPTRATVRTRQPDISGLIGAGIVENSIVPGTPKYVLLTPTGKILAYLESESVDLSRHIGQPMGLEGSRSFREDLKTDYIKVQTLKPIQLRN
jgi:hypothetical protein